MFSQSILHRGVIENPKSKIQNYLLLLKSNRFQVESCFFIDPKHEVHVLNRLT